MSKSSTINNVSLKKNATHDAPLKTFVQPKLMVNEPGDKYEQEADTMAEKLKPSAAYLAALNLENSRTPGVGGCADGSALPAMTRKFIENAFSADFSGVRIHTGSEAESMNRQIGAKAFVHRNDIYFNRNQFDLQSEDGISLLIHELTHTIQQRNEKEPGVFRQPDPMQLLDTDWIKNASNERLLGEIRELQKSLGQSGFENPKDIISWSNLDSLLKELASRNFVDQLPPPQFAKDKGDLASAGQIESLRLNYQVHKLKAQEIFKEQQSSLGQKFDTRIGYMSAIHKEAVYPEGASIEALKNTIDSIIESKKILPAEITKDENLRDPEINFRTSVKASISSLLTEMQTSSLMGMEIARINYMAAFARILIRSANMLKTELPKLRNIPNLSNYKEGLFTRVEGGRWQGGNDVDYLMERIDAILGKLDSYGDMVEKSNLPAPERVAFLQEHGDEMSAMLGQSQALSIAAAGMALIGYFQDQISSREKFGDATMINSMREHYVESMLVPLQHNEIPSLRQIQSAQIDYERDAPEETGKTKREEQLKRHRAFLNLDDNQNPYETSVRSRFKEMSDFDRNFQIFLGIVSSFIGMCAGASLAAGAMRAGPFAEGGMLAARTGAGAWRIGAIRFVTSSLIFTSASQTIQAILMNRVPTIKDALKTAAFDMATMGFMHGVGVKFGVNGVVPPNIQFAALWTWSAGWGIGEDIISGDFTIKGALKKLVVSGIETKLMLRALGMAEKIGMLPSYDLAGGMHFTKTTEQLNALELYKKVQSSGKGIREDAIKWQNGEQRPEALDELLSRSETFMGEYNKALDQMGKNNLIEGPAIEALKSEAKNQSSVVRNVRDSIRLGMKLTDQNLIRYTGESRNVDMYLNRNKRDGIIKDFVPIERGGIYKVTYPDGTVTFFYPERAPLTQSIGQKSDFRMQTIERIVPETESAMRELVAKSLQALPGGLADQILVACENSPNAKEILGYLTKPEILAEAARPGTLYNAELFSQAANGNASAIDLLKNTDPASLNRWYQTAFEKGLGGARNLETFNQFLKQLADHRGGLTINNLTEAIEYTDYFNNTKELGWYDPAFKPRTEPQGMYDPGVPRKPRGYTRDDYFKQIGVTENLKLLPLEDGTWVLQMSGGQPVQAWYFKANEARPNKQIDITAKATRLRNNLAELQKQLETDLKNPGAVQPGDPARKKLYDDINADLSSLDFLKRVRGAKISEITSMLDLPHRLDLQRRMAAGTAPDLAAPVPGEPIPEPIILEPVTPGELLDVRLQKVRSTANELGRLEDGPIKSLENRDPRIETSPDQRKSFTEALEAAEKHLADNPHVSEAKLIEVLQSKNADVPKLIPESEIDSVLTPLIAEYPVLKHLPRGAIERIARAAFAIERDGTFRPVTKGAVPRARGVLLEELSSIQIDVLLKDPAGRKLLGFEDVAGDVIFIEGHRVRDANGAMFTDGVFVVRRGGQLEIVGVAESKAGKFAADKLAESMQGIKRAPTTELLETLRDLSRSVNTGIMRQIKNFDPQLHKIITEDISKLSVTEISQLREPLLDSIWRLPARDISRIRMRISRGQGQIALDVERLMTSDDRLIQIQVDGQPIQAHVPTRPKFFAVTPEDVDLNLLSKPLPKAYSMEALPMGDFNFKTQQLSAMADKIIKALGTYFKNYTPPAK